jgi:hypothetical protein
MKKLHQLLGYDKAIVGDFGIEIEVEGENLVKVDTNDWKTDKDGSLRGEAFEYIFKKPALREDVRKNLEYLAKRLKGSKLDFSFRTSVHVHMNMMDCTHVQLLNAIYTYLLLEEPFLSYCGKERKGNRFCLRLQDAEGILEILNHIFKGDLNSFKDIGRDSIRYASINLEALLKYGSLEFRAMRGNLNVEVIDTWVEALYRLRDFAMKIEDPLAIFNLYTESSPEEFMSKVLGDISPKFHYPKLTKDVQKSFSLSLDLPYAYKYRPVEVFKKRGIPIADVHAIPILNDIEGNELHIGDRVRIVDKDKDAEVFWADEMDHFVDDGVLYTIAYIGSAPDHIRLEGLDYVFPPTCVELFYRAEDDELVENDEDI